MVNLKYQIINPDGVDNKQAYSFEELKQYFEPKQKYYEDLDLECFKKDYNLWKNIDNYNVLMDFFLLENTGRYAFYKIQILFDKGFDKELFNILRSGKIVNKDNACLFTKNSEDFNFSDENETWGDFRIIFDSFCYAEAYGYIATDDEENENYCQNNPFPYVTLKPDQDIRFYDINDCEINNPFADVEVVFND